MRREIPCRTFRGWHATKRVASIGQREVQIQADGRRAELANSLEIVFDSANAWVQAGSFPLQHTSCCCFVVAD